MINEFAVSRNPATLGISLKTIWLVEADTSYDIYKKDLLGNDTILIRTVKGEGILIAEGMDPFYLAEETFFLIESRKIRRYYCSQEKWDFWWFEISITGSSGLPYHQVIHSPNIDKEDEKVIDCMKFLQEDDPVMPYLASSYFSVMMYSWLKNSRSPFHPPLLYEKEMRETAIYMKTHLGDKITVVDLAKRVGVCSKHFRELFKAVYHITPKKYFDQIRMLSAEALLKNTNRSVSEISESLGYSSSFHFTREFKKYYKNPPTAFRKGDGYTRDS